MFALHLFPQTQCGHAQRLVRYSHFVRRKFNQVRTEIDESSMKETSMKRTEKRDYLGTNTSGPPATAYHLIMRDFISSPASGMMSQHWQRKREAQWRLTHRMGRKQFPHSCHSRLLAGTLTNCHCVHFKVFKPTTQSQLTATTSHERVSQI